VHIDDDQGTESGALELGKLSSHQLHSLLKLIVQFLEVLVKAGCSFLQDSLFDF